MSIEIRRAQDGVHEVWVKGEKKFHGTQAACRKWVAEYARLQERERQNDAVRRVFGYS
jgi:hypothetical protein